MLSQFLLVHMNQFLKFDLSLFSFLCRPCTSLVVLCWDPTLVIGMWPGGRRWQLMLRRETLPLKAPASFGIQCYLHEEGGGLCLLTKGHLYMPRGSGKSETWESKVLKSNSPGICIPSLRVLFRVLFLFLTQDVCPHWDSSWHWGPTILVIRFWACFALSAFWMQKRSVPKCHQRGPQL